jgi:LysR family transcriptional regulator of gallate degradation
MSVQKHRISKKRARPQDMTNAFEETKIPPGTGHPIGDADISLRHLFVFATVAREGSAASAAGKLLRGSSAIVRSVGALERQLGERLFDRHPRGMVINAFGQAVLTRADRIAAELTELSQAVDERRSAPPGGRARAIFSALPNSRSLAVVVALAERSNMAAVAREFGLTHAAISTALKTLEDRSEIELFDRSPRGLVTTELGQIVVFRFRRCLAELRHIDSDLSALKGTMQGLVRVGALPLGRTMILPRCLASTVSKYPQLQFATLESPYDILAAQLRSGDIDFIFGALRPPHETGDLSQYALFDDRVSVISRSGHPLARKEALGVDDLRGEKWILWRPESPARASLRRTFLQSGLDAPHPCIETGDVAILRGVLLQSDMLTAISASQLRYEIESKDLTVLPIALKETRRSIGITLRFGALPSSGARILIDEIRALIDRMISRGELLPVAHPGH